MKKNTKLLIGIGILVLLLAGGLTWFLLKKYNTTSKNDDAIKFAEEYGITEDNVFVYRDADEIIRIMEKGTGVVYLGFPECPWCKAYVEYLNEVAQEVGIEKIYYYNILNDRNSGNEKFEDSTPEYQKMVAILEDYLELDAEAMARIYVPNVSFHVNGTIVGNDLETAYDTHGFENPEDYWTEEEVSNLKATLKGYMEKVAKELSTCTDCNK